MKILLTRSFMEYLTRNETESSSLPTAIIVQDCALGGHCNGGGDLCFPFHVLKMDNSEARANPTLIKNEDPSIPSSIEIYIGKELIGGLLEPLILDYIQVNGMDFPFIPPIPLPMDQYSFYPVE